VVSKVTTKKTKMMNATYHPSFGCGYNVKKTTTMNKHLSWWFRMLQHIKKARTICHLGLESTHNEKKLGQQVLACHHGLEIYTRQQK
jgi:hypothetical protein